MIIENIKLSRALSKSLYIRGLQCHKSLYLHKQRPELRDEISEEQEALFQAGHDVGNVARQLFPNGMEIPYEGLSHAEQIGMTTTAIAAGASTLYEAAFDYDGVFVKVDILRKGPDGWEIYEVKSSTEVKDVHIDDTALQYYVVTGSCLQVAIAAVLHINNQYVRSNEINPAELFTVYDITAEAKEKQPFVKENISRMREMLAAGQPDTDIGEHCDDPYPCDFQGQCWKYIPEDSVFDLRRRGVNKFDLYRQGIVKMQDIPLDILNKAQSMQVEALVQGKTFLDKLNIQQFLDTLFYPLYFLDFETFYSPLPLFDGIRPYQQVPFQYSLHSLASEGASLKHAEFLAEANTDPRHSLITQLLRDIPEKACIIAYTSFESARLRDLADWFPAYRKRIEGMISNIRDLAVPFKQMDYYHRALNGSYSIKSVLPHLVSEMSYDGLEVKNGGMAIDAWFRMSASADPAETEAIRNALLEYCGVDTLAMVKILERLREMCQ